MRTHVFIVAFFMVLALAHPASAQTQTAFCSGYRENPSAEFDYSGTWTNATAYGFGWYGNNLQYSTVATARVSLYTCASVGTLILYYFMGANYGTVDILIDGAAYGTLNQYSVVNIGRAYVQINLAYGNHVVELVNRAGGQWINIDAAEVVARVVAPTVVLFLPTHTPTFTPSPTWTPTPTPTLTPTPTPTPTLTPTAGPSPTATFTPSPTPREPVAVRLDGGGEVVIENTISPDGVFQAILLMGLLAVSLLSLFRREAK